MITVSVFDVTVAFSGTISETAIARPLSASFATKAVLKAAAKLCDFVGSLSVSSTAVASASDVVTNSYSTLSFVPCNCLSSAGDSLRPLRSLIAMMVTFDGSTPKPSAMEPATLLTKVVSAASASAVTFSGKLPKAKVSADLIVYVVTFSTRVVVGPSTTAAVVAGAAAVVGAAVVVITGLHVGYGVAKTPKYGVLYTHEKLEPLAV
jgi:hypothetical protein